MARRVEQVSDVIDFWVTRCDACGEAAPREKRKAVFAEVVTVEIRVGWLAVGAVEGPEEEHQYYCTKCAPSVLAAMAKLPRARLPEPAAPAPR